MSVHGEILQSLATGMLLAGEEKLVTACEANEVEWIEVIKASFMG